RRPRPRPVAPRAGIAPGTGDADDGGTDGQRARAAHRGRNGRDPAPRARRGRSRMSTLARIEDEWHHEVPVARLQGEVDASTVDEVRERLRSLLTNRSVALVVDLSRTTYLDSAGINLLFALGDEMRGRQQRLAIVVADPSPIARMVTLTGLDQAMAVH